MKSTLQIKLNWIIYSWADATRSYACHFRNMDQVVHQSQHTRAANQSEHILGFGRRGFIETGTNQVI